MEDKRERKRREILEVMRAYRDQYGNVDLTKLRRERPNVYSRISYYFGSIDGALEEFINAEEGNAIPARASRGSSVNRLTLRNQLAYDMLEYLRRELTLEDIAVRYGVSRAYVNQLHQSLKRSVGAVRKEIREQRGLPNERDSVTP